MNDDRYYDRGQSRFPARDVKEYSPSSSSRAAFSASHINNNNNTVNYNSYAEHAYKQQRYDLHSRSSSHPHSHGHGHSQQYHVESSAYPQRRGSQMEVDWAYTSAASRSPPSVHPAQSYRARAEAPVPHSAALPAHSDWLVLPSVSHALRMYGDSRRPEPRFSLVIRQQPRRGLAIGNSQMSLRTARSVPIDPPPVCELLINRSGDEQLLSLPEVFIRAQLVRGDSPMEECLPDARKIEPLVGDTLQSPFNSRIDTREDQSFFVFKELGVRNRGMYRLRFDLFDRVGLRIFKVASVYSDVFEVQERRKHPGLTASSALMDALVDRGIKYKLRKANDKQNPKKRKSPDDFYYGDARSVSAARRQSYAAPGADYEPRQYGGSFSSDPSSLPPFERQQMQQQQMQGQSQQHAQLQRPIAHRPYVSDKGFGVVADDRREMLPPITSVASNSAAAYAPTSQSGYRLSPPSSRAVMTDKVPQLPSLSRLPPPSRPYAVPQLQLHESSPLPAHPQLHAPQWRQQEEEYTSTNANSNAPARRLSPHNNNDERRPPLDFRSSSSSVSTTNSTGGREPSSSSASAAAPATPSSSATENTPAPHEPGFGKFESEQLGKLSHRTSLARLRDSAYPSPSGSSTSSSASSNNSNGITLPPISSFYDPARQS